MRLMRIAVALAAALALNAPWASACLSAPEKATCCGGDCPMREGPSSCCAASPDQPRPLPPLIAAPAAAPSGRPALVEPARRAVVLGARPAPLLSSLLFFAHSGLSPPAA